MRSCFAISKLKSCCNRLVRSRPRSRPFAFLLYCRPRAIVAEYEPLPVHLRKLSPSTDDADAALTRHRQQRLQRVAAASASKQCNNNACDEYFTSYLMGHGITELSDLTGLLLIVTGIQVLQPFPRPLVALPHRAPHLPPSKSSSQNSATRHLDPGISAVRSQLFSSYPSVSLRVLLLGNKVGPVKPFLDAKGAGSAPRAPCSLFQQHSF